MTERADQFSITLAQLNPTVGDVAGNAAKVRTARASAKADDPYGSGPRRFGFGFGCHFGLGAAAVSQGETDAGVPGVVGGRGGAEFGREPLVAVLHGPVLEGAHGEGLGRVVALAHAQRSVEISDHDERIAVERPVHQDHDPAHERGGGDP